VVLLVESDPSARDLYRTALHDAGGFTVLLARDEIDAVRRLDASTPDVVVLSLADPVDNDLVAAMTVRGIAHVPVIAVTADDPATLDRTGFARVVTKPLDLDDLVEAILECLSERRGANIAGVKTGHWG
jgi:CheY-like chemotaxis protein